MKISGITLRYIPVTLPSIRFFSFPNFKRNCSAVIKTVLQSRHLNRNCRNRTFCHSQNRNRHLAVGSGSGSGSVYKKSLKYGFDTLVLKGLKEGVQNKQFEVKISLFIYSTVSIEI